MGEGGLGDSDPINLKGKEWDVRTKSGILSNWGDPIDFRGLLWIWGGSHRGAAGLVEAAAALQLLVELPAGGVLQDEVDALAVVEVVVEAQHVGVPGAGTPLYHREPPPGPYRGPTRPPRSDRWAWGSISC